MSFEVTIIRNSDRERIVLTDPGEWNEGQKFWWTEGNGSCDCNRRGLFLIAQGDPDPDYGECGDTEFSVIITWENT